MTKEQEAIENLTDLLKQRYEKEVTITTFDLFENIETVLNMLKEKDKEIEHWKNKFEEELEDNRKNTCELLKQDLEIKEKDKQMDLMADSFAEEGFYNEHCQTLTDNELCPNDCNKCVKQYFEKLAKEKGE